MIATFLITGNALVWGFIIRSLFHDSSFPL